MRRIWFGRKESVRLVVDHSLERRLFSLRSLLRVGVIFFGQEWILSIGGIIIHEGKRFRLLWGTCIVLKLWLITRREQTVTAVGCK